jgi:hypothetical protein
MRPNDVASISLNPGRRVEILGEFWKPRNWDGGKGGWYCFQRPENF